MWLSFYSAPSGIGTSVAKGSKSGDTGSKLASEIGVEVTCAGGETIGSPTGSGGEFGAGTCTGAGSGAGTRGGVKVVN